MSVFLCSAFIVSPLVKGGNEVQEEGTVSPQLRAMNASNHFQTIGTAPLKVMWFDVYDATLSSASGRYEEGEPILLRLEYARDISKRALVNETRKQLQNQLSSHSEKPSDQHGLLFDELKLEEGLSRLSELWPSVEQGDVISFYLDDADTGVFLFNDQYLGDIRIQGFAKAFADIWLGESSEYPELARRLKGEFKRSDSQSKVKAEGGGYVHE
ncbi:MAG: chalcone isomerase family protein [Pontibacterium sp.]